MGSIPIASVYLIRLLSKIYVSNLNTYFIVGMYSYIADDIGSGRVLLEWFSQIYFQKLFTK
jgi:hypothetical protein